MSKGQSKKCDTYLQLFKEADKNGDGYLTVHELESLLKKSKSKMSQREIAVSFELIIVLQISSNFLTLLIQNKKNIKT